MCTLNKVKEMKLSMEDIKLEDLVEYFRNNNLSISETLYLLNLYKLSKNLENDTKDNISVQNLFCQLSKLNNWLKTANNTNFVSERINKEIIILEKANKMLQNKELNKVTNIYNEIAF